MRYINLHLHYIYIQEGTGQNYLARTHGNGYVTDKPRMMMNDPPMVYFFIHRLFANNAAK